MPETLSKSIAEEYRRKAQELPPNEKQDAGERRRLRIELQNRCGITELMALNIINGFHTDIYIAIEERKAIEKEEMENGI